MPSRRLWRLDKPLDPQREQIMQMKDYFLDLKLRLIDIVWINGYYGMTLVS